MKNEKQILKKLDDIISLIKKDKNIRLREYIKRPLELEEENFKINSDGWHKITIDSEEYLENPEKDVWELLSEECRGEQLFTYDAAMRETEKAGKLIPSDEQLSELLKAAEDLKNVKLPGYRGTNGAFYFLGSYLYLWSSTESSSTTAWRRYIFSSYSTVAPSAVSKGYGFSVRCLKN